MADANAGLSRSGVMGARRRRTPVASKTALARAAATGRIELSPAPAGGNSGRFRSTMSIDLDLGDNRDHRTRALGVGDATPGQSVAVAVGPRRGTRLPSGALGR